MKRVEPAAPPAHPPAAPPEGRTLGRTRFTSAMQVRPDDLDMFQSGLLRHFAGILELIHFRKSDIEGGQIRSDRMNIMGNRTRIHAAA